MPPFDSSSKKILAIAMSGYQRAQANALWNGEQLFITDIIEITKPPATWLKAMIEDINAKVQSRANNWVVMVEDRTASFPSNAISFNFDEVTEGRTNMQHCLDWYFDLQGRGAILFDDAIMHYALRQGGENDIVDFKNDEKGRMIYNVNWQAIKAGHKAMLMCVAGAVREEPLSERWMRVFSKVDPVEEPEGLPIFRAMKQQYKDHYEAFEASVAALEARKEAARKRNVRH